MPDPSVAVDPLLITEDVVERILDERLAYDAAEETFRLLGRGEAANGLRARLERDGMRLTSRMAIAPTLGAMGMKIYPTVRRDVSQGSAFTTLLYTVPGGRFDAMLESATLSLRRTGATSALAARYLARADSTVLGLVGCGWQARGQVEAIVRVLPALESVILVGRSPERRERMAAWLKEAFALRVADEHDAETVATADVIVTATGSAEPVFAGAGLQPGSTVIAMGSNFPTKREIDTAAVQAMDRIVVDALDVAQVEAGDLLLNGFAEWDRVEELGAVVAGGAPGRRTDEEKILFSSQGLGIQDIVTAAMVVRQARSLGLGHPLALTSGGPVER